MACGTCHHACECREAAFEDLRTDLLAKNAALRAKLAEAEAWIAEDNRVETALHALLAERTQELDEAHALIRALPCEEPIDCPECEGIGTVGHRREPCEACVDATGFSSGLGNCGTCRTCKARQLHAKGEL